jgi:hypothetical protein
MEKRGDNIPLDNDKADKEELEEGARCMAIVYIIVDVLSVALA